MTAIPAKPAFTNSDPYLEPFGDVIERRAAHTRYTLDRLTDGSNQLGEFASAHEYYGLHRSDSGWVFREWAPNATAIWLVGDFSGWERLDTFALKRISDSGDWEVQLPQEALAHENLYKLHVCWDGGEGDRIPAYARRVVQDDSTKIFTTQVWAPNEPYVWQHEQPDRAEPTAIYESHVGMAQEDGRVGSYDEFREHVLPRIKRAGYNTVQLMAILEHPYYGSFGYHVSNFFAASSRFGTPEALKALVDEAHRLDMAVIVDLVHSHSVSNEIEGLSCFDGTQYQYFHEGARGSHEAWDSRCFDYGKPEVLHFLLSNCKYWLDEYRIDGFRFDGVTSMMYHHRGLGTGFGNYDAYFGGDVDDDALAYLALANTLIHEVFPNAITIAEDVSGMPGLCAPPQEGGCGFDFRLAMGMPDTWFKLVRDVKDEDWSMQYIWQQLTDHRPEERTISYVESHDQAIVGDKTMMFELVDAAMYDSMSTQAESLAIDRGMALHKLLRLATASTANGGYLNFMGNEFGHPEWIDFPREGNGWSYHYARRQWSLRDDPGLRFHFLADFDQAMLEMMTSGEITADKPPRFLYAHDGDKILAFERNGLYFIFNFHPEQSFTDYGIEVIPGKYELVMNSDEARFGGHSRIASDQEFIPQPVMDGNLQRNMLKLYIPCRTALVLKRIQQERTACKPGGLKT
ncbi:MAG: 1,4-alpha-glucan-branching enzyme [Verrucomicrobia bacterium]|nr:1,4-alpha-glucan-branching enzyme [Verrucomicrobiota bacterium]